MTSEQESEDRVNGRSWVWPVILAFVIQTAAVAFFLGRAYQQIAINTAHMEHMDDEGTRALTATQHDLANLRDRMDRLEPRGGK